MESKLLSKLPVNIRETAGIIVAKYDINTPERKAHFFSQCDHESGGFKHVRENLNYSAKRLLQVFPKYFRSLAEANLYAHNPVKIGSRVYGNRMGNGAEETKDGYRYSGRGYIQCTGKNLYAELSKEFGVDLLAFPDKLAAEFPLESAAWYWKTRGLNEIADLGITMEVCEKVTKKVNGGRNGLLSRFHLLRYYFDLLSIGGANGKTAKMD
jgi:putative chitinase